MQLTASDGHALAAYRAEPAGAPRGAIVVIQEIFGVNHHVRNVADGFAHDGYVAIAPAMFDRVQRGVELGYTPDGVREGRELRSKIDIDAAMRDVTAAVAEAAPAGKIGIVGYCWGGTIAWVAAARVAGLACAVSYYGGGVLDHAALEPRCPVQAHFGKRDQMIPVAEVGKLAAEVHVYEADHGFNCDERGSYDAAAAKLARERTLAFFRTHVG